MDEPAKSKRMPWPFLLLMILVAGSTVFVHVYFAEKGEVNPASVTFMTLVGLTVFVITRLLLNSLWGLIAAGLIVAHPLFRHVSHENQFDVLAEWLTLAIMLCVLLMWKMVLQSRQRFFALCCLGTIQCIIVGWAWVTSPRAGCAAALLAVLGSLFAGILGLLQRRSKAPENGPAILNIVLSFLLTAIVPAASLAVAFGLSQSTHRLNEYKLDQWKFMIAQPMPVDSGINCIIDKAFRPASDTYLPHILAEESDAPPWHLPNRWVVLAVLCLGLFRSFRRGWVQRNETPLSWILILMVPALVAAGILHGKSAEESHFLSLATLADLLFVFGVADLIRSVSERMVLNPPAEESEEMGSE